MKNLWIFTAFLLCSHQMIGQNLLKNPSFEDSAPCNTEGWETIDSAKHWNAIAGNPEFLNLSCSLRRDVRMHVQQMDIPPANEGNVYAGIWLNEESEFLQGELTKPLEAGKPYIIKMKARFAGKLCYGPIQELGVALTNTNFEKSETPRIIEHQAVRLQSEFGDLIDMQYQWEEIYAIFTAEGGETFLTIGNFSNCNVGLFESRKDSLQQDSINLSTGNISNIHAALLESRQKACTYLYIDNISIEEYQPVKIKTYEIGQTLKPKQHLILEEVTFVSGFAKMERTSYETLDALATTLTEQEELSIQILGHTDNSQDESSSRIYSEAQAKAVQNYLILKGVDKERITAIGVGRVNKLVLNDSEENRAKNNRIEIKIE